MVPEAAWQRCCVHFLRNVLDYLPRETNENWMEANRHIDTDDLREHKKLALRQAA